MLNFEFTLTGQKISPGLAAGPAWVFRHRALNEDHYLIENDRREWEKLQAALQEADRELGQLELKSASESEAQTEIIQVHRQLLADPEWLEQMQSHIQSGGSALSAVKEVSEQFAQMMAAMDDDYLKERSQDIRDIASRVQRLLLGHGSETLLPESGEYILVAPDLTPSQFAALDKKRVLGLITETGGATAHTAIMARLYEIPALSGIEKASEKIKNNDWLFLHADHQALALNPKDFQREEMKSHVQKYHLQKQSLMSLKDLPAITRDGCEVQLEANIGRIEDLELVEKYHVSGIGLFRTEFLFFDREQAPSEQEQFESYLETARRTAGHPPVIRTFDIGADKQVSYLSWPREENPFLGLRALRYCLKEAGLFRTQLRALLRASSEKPLKIMFPMVSALEELLEAKKILLETEYELRAQGLSPQYDFGVMIEVPSAALMADLLAEHVDFFSLGTNDLIQYVCAVDRMNEQVSHLYQPFHPAVLRLISQVIKAGASRGVEVGMCGEMASNPLLIPVLLGMGLRIFSQSPGTVLASKALIRRLNLMDCQSLWKEIENMGSAPLIEAKAREFLKLTEAIGS